MKTRILISIILLLATLAAKAQERYFQPLGRMYDLDMQAKIAADESEDAPFSAVKPVLIPSNEPLPIEKEPLGTARWLRTHFFEDDFLQFSSDIHTITVNPILHFQRTYVRSDKDAELNYFKRQYKNGEHDGDKFYFLNTRGFEAFGRLGKRIYFNTEFYENQARYPRYEDSIINVMRGIPGQGFGKAFKVDGKDWAMVFGHISVDVNKHLTLTLGNGKNSIGSGYRSVILSDLSFNYPFLRADLQFGKFYYYVLWGYMQSDHWSYFSTHETGESHYKYASYHVAGWKPNNQLELSVVEGVMWRNTNKDNVYKYGPNAMMFVPVIGLPLASYGFNDDNRVQIGFDVNYTPIKYIKLYGQYNYQGKNRTYNAHDFYGYQIGLHWFDLAFDNIKGLKSHLQLEFTNSNISDGRQSSDFWNYGYPLTTLNVTRPDISEIYLAADIEYKRVAVEGLWQHTQFSDRKALTLRYMLNRKTKWNIYATMLSRKVEFSNNDYDNNMLVIGMAICPQNFYFDF
ncbi:MAG: hypothetical protein II852_12265 [Bacteroidales bacterium]|nr:hypothetical protein [Bacteroidales bacterium]